MIAIGLRSGVGILKKAETLLSGKEEARIYPLNYKESTKKQMSESLDEQIPNVKEDKVTFIGMISNPTRLVYGSKAGYLTFYNLQKEEDTVSFQMQSEDMKRIVQVIELPN